MQANPQAYQPKSQPTHVFYTPRQIPSIHSSFSQSPLKPKMLANKLAVRASDNLILTSDIPAITPSTLYSIHDKDYVNAILSGMIPDGFGRNCTPQQAESLLFTSANLLAAVEWVTGNRSAHGAVSLTSGFHHAGHNSAEGFCTFNGLMLAADELASTGKRTLILDGDQHYGNGCVDILTAKPELREYVSYHYFRPRKSAALWLSHLDSQLRALVDASNPDLIIYQAGADPYINDPLGGWLTMEELQIRDEIIFDFCKTNDISIVWNLAGGYCEDYGDTLQIHMNTFAAWEDVFYPV